MRTSPFEHPSATNSRETAPPSEERDDSIALKLPDLSEPEPEIYTRTSKIETEIHLKENTYPCILTFERLKESTSANHQKMQLHLELFNSTKDERIAVFKGALICEKPTSSDKKEHVYWRIYTRRVDESLRGSGIGSTCLEAYEQICRGIGDVYPSLKAEWITISTRLTSLTRLLIDQDWLKTHGLSEYARGGKTDFGYIPQPKDEKNVSLVLSAGTEELQDVTDKNTPEIELRKML